MDRKRGKEKKKSVLFACLGEEQMGPRILEIPEIGANSACRHINLANVMGGNGWGRKNWEKGCSSIIDTCFNGGGLCSFSCVCRYVEYLGVFCHKTTLYKKGAKPLKLVFGNAHGRVSVQGAVLPIWITDSFRPERVRLLVGKTELLLGLDIVKKLDISVVFGSAHSGLGGENWE